MLQDFRLAARMLRKQPGFTLVAVLTLALGIGATAAVFSLIQGVLLTPPPYRQPQQIALIQPVRADGQPVGQSRAWPAQQWLQWKEEATSLASVAAYSWTFNYLIQNDGSESMEGLWVTRDYFSLTGLHPMMGRVFTESDATPKAPPVILIGYEFWKRKFDGDPDIVGKTLRMSRRDTPLTIVGVMPPNVRFLPSPANAQEPNYNVNAAVDFWLPFAPDPQHLKQPDWDVVARLRDGVSWKQAQSELSVLVASQAKSERDFEGIRARMEPLSEELNSDGRRILLPLLGAAALVLLIACGNVAALLLVRGLQRQQEYAIRTALGVSRSVLFRQISTESLLLALLGAFGGIALAFAAVRVFKLIAIHAVPRLDSVTTGWPVLAWGLCIAVAAALLAGVIPALRASGLDPIEVLKRAGPKSSSGPAERRLLRGVTTVQTALTLALLVGAGLLIRTMSNVSKVQTGYRVDHILTMSVTAVQGKWADFHERALDRVTALPGVTNAAFAWGVPLTGNNWPAHIVLEGQPAAVRETDRLSFPLRSVTPGYFALLGLPLLDGRDFRSSDKRGAPSVAVVNQALADRYFPHAAVGKKLWLGDTKGSPTVIIGVAADARNGDLTKPAQPEIYLSMWQASPFSKHLIVRTSSDPVALSGVIQRTLRSVDPTVAVENVKTLAAIRDDSLASRAFAMQLLIGFALVGGVLTLVGIYGVLSLSVASRRRELAIRAAVGAGRTQIRNLVFAEGFRLIAVGVLAGLGASLVLTRVLKSLLFEVSPADPVTLVSVGLIFAAVALLACWAPTRRAATVDPVEALRYE